MPKNDLEATKLRIAFIVQDLIGADYDDDLHPVVARAIMDLVDLCEEDEEDDRDISEMEFDPASGSYH